jgi:hypothetical protein
METNNTIISENGIILEEDFDQGVYESDEEVTVADAWAAEMKTVEEKHEEFFSRRQKELFISACAISGTLASLTTAFITFMILR